jgi:hypothetical protein
MQIYIGRDGQREGPFTIEEVRARIAQGQARPDDLAWYDGAPGWMPLREVPGLQQPVATVVPPAIPSPPPPIPRPSVGIPGPITAQQPQETLAIVSLVLGILGLVAIPFIASIPGVVCGHMALGKIKRAAGTLGGRGLAIGGLVTGYLGIVICLAIAAVIAIAVTAVVKSAGPFKQQVTSGIETFAAVASATQIHASCTAYAAANDGKFPPTLEALVPTYLSDAEDLETKVGDEDERGGFQYFGGTTSDPPDRVLFQSWGTLPNGHRVVAYVDGRIEVEETPATIPLEQSGAPENSSKEQ